MSEKKRLGELLLDAGYITKEQLHEALEEQKTTHMRLGETLLQKGFINEEQLSKIIAEQLGSSTMDLNLLAIKPQTIRLIPKEICITHKVLPIIKTENTITLAMADPYDVVTQDLIKMITTCNIKVVVCKESDIINAIQHFYPEEAELEEVVSKLVPNQSVEIVKTEDEEEGGQVELRDLKSESSTQPIIKLVNSIIVDAIKMRASDIHIEHGERGIQVRYRVDGLLRKVATLPSYTNLRIVSRIKIIAGMDIAETRAPQDGRCRIKFEKKEYDLRVSTIPTYYGEKIVMRILNKSAAFLSLEKIGLLTDDLTLLRNAINNKQGIVLSTGPTGSGKSSTLFSLIDQIKDETRNIVTLEDPIEYDLEGINQVQVNERAGITFASGLRSILRQDPDVVMVGEIRDGETAKIAFNAAMTGHLVLSTLHTNDAPTAITRLAELEVSPFLITASLKSIVAQRLVRKVCENCKDSYYPEDDIYIMLGLNPKNKIPFYRGRGCENCQFTGYYGRLGIFEILTLNDDLRELIAKGASSTAITKEAQKFGMKNLFQDALLKVLQGLTTPEEVLRVISWDQLHKEQEVAKQATQTAELEILCSKCANPIKPDWKICPHCLNSIVRQNFCKVCGIEMKPEWNYCPKCQTPVIPEKVVAQSNVTPMPQPQLTLVQPKIEAGRPTVLLVNDDTGTLNYLKDSIKTASQEFEVLTAHNSSEALQMAFRYKPDIIASKFQLPGEDGKELCRKLKMKLQTRSIYFMMIAADSGEELLSIEAGADDVLKEPFKIELLLAKITAQFTKLQEAQSL